MSKNLKFFIHLIPMSIAGLIGVALGMYLGYGQGYRNGCSDTILIYFDLGRPSKNSRYHENKKILDMFSNQQ